MSAIGKTRQTALLARWKGRPGSGPAHLIGRELANIQHGRFERALSGLTAAAALITTAEVYLEHYKASFGNKWMWSPVLVTPPVVIAGIGGVFSRRWAKTALPAAAALYTLNGLAGEYFHARGVARKPGGWRQASYNVPMGPPIAAPGLMSIVGGMGLLAAILRREKKRGTAVPDFRQPDHLPNLRPDRRPPDPSWLPRQRRGTTPQMVGRYPDYDVLDSAGTWDEATKKVVFARLGRPGPLRFFTVEEEPALRAFCDTALAQDRDPRVPVAESVDAKLADGRLDGFQYADMPDDRDTWRLVLQGLDEVARARYGKPGFAAAEQETREAIVGQFADGVLAGGTWDMLNGSRAWSVCMRSVLSAFYSHPWAWNEIGFGGPAYLRGLMRLGPVSTTEPFERHGATDEDPARAPGLDGGGHG